MSWTALGRVGLAAFVLVLARVEVASACSIDPCAPPVRLNGMEYVPGNLVYFEVTAQNPPVLSLRTEAGEPIPASVRTIGGDRVFAPEEPIAPETTVVLDYQYDCFYPELYSRDPGQFAFQTTAHRSITLEQGSLYVDEYGVSSVEDPIRTFAFTRLRLRSPDPDYSAEHLMTHTLTIDGEDIGGQLVGSQWQFSVNSNCFPAAQNERIQRDSCGGLHSVPVGQHRLELKPHVLGYEGEVAPITIDIETRCPAPDGSLPVPSDGSETSGEGASSGDPSPGTPPDDASTPEAASPDVDVASDADEVTSCALTVGQPASRATSVAAALVLALALVAGWRRRAR